MEGRSGGSLHRAEEESAGCASACSKSFDRLENRQGGKSGASDVAALSTFMQLCGFEEAPALGSACPHTASAERPAMANSAAAAEKSSSQAPLSSVLPSPPPPPPPGFFDEIGKVGPPTLSSQTAEASSSRRVIVFDFDQTLAVTQTTPSKLVDTVRRVFGGQGRVDMLRDLFQKLDRQGVIMVVVSFNSKETIERAMADKRVGLLDFFRHPLHDLYDSVHFKTAFSKDEWAQAVLGSEIFDDMRDWRKSSAVARVLSSLGASPENLLFVDDNSANCKDVEERLPGSKTIRVGVTLGQWGITFPHCLHILAWAGHTDEAGAGCKDAGPDIEPYFSSDCTCSGDSVRSERSLTGLDDEWPDDGDLR